MHDGGYSTVMDAILFLMLVGICAVILGPAISGHASERSVADRGLREIAADVLCTLETEQVDYFEYRVLGDVADRIVAVGGINVTQSVLYLNMATALLGRGNRHMAVMDIAAGGAACQFLVEYGDTSVQANPVTAEYSSAVSALVDQEIRSCLDSRYQYEFTLRWTPLIGVPIAGEVRSGGTCPSGAASSSMQVTMPCTTGITRALIEQACISDLEEVDRCIDEYRVDGDAISLRQRLGDVIGNCLKNTTALAMDEIWNNTLGSSFSVNSSINPLKVLGEFIDGKTSDMREMIGLNLSVKDRIDGLGDGYYHAEANGLAEEMTADIVEDKMNAADARRMLLDWLKARYKPSSAIATVSVWTGAYA